MGTELAIRPLSPPMGLLGNCISPVLLDQAIAGLDHGHGADRDLDAAIYEALGWQVDRAGRGGRRRLAWRVRSPWARAWDVLPSPTADEADAARLVPWRWSYSAGVVDGRPQAWCRDRKLRPGHDLPVFFEATRTTVARSLSVAALFAQRHVAREAMGHG